MITRCIENTETHLIDIVALDSKGRGVGRYSETSEQLGKIVFIEGALPGEKIRYRVTKNKRNYAEGKLLEIIKISSQRVTPRCAYFSECGGCTMQHIESRAQLAFKQRQLEDSLWHIGKVRAEQILRPIAGADWGYRHRARLSVFYFEKRDTVLIGFHQQQSNYIAEIMSCEILPPYISALLPKLKKLIATLSVRNKIPQIEMAIGTHINALVLRILKPLTSTDEEYIREFADCYNVQFWLQPKGPDSVYCFYPKQGELSYALPEYGITMPFLPTDFTQVNHRINQVLIRHALNLLDAQKHERILDLFCGIGNFTLPLATQSAAVVGIEGSQTLCIRAQQNAQANQLAHKTSFISQNLFNVNEDDIYRWGKFDRWLIDPPREGAHAVVLALAQLKLNHIEYLPRRLVYVSCNPATLARDAAVLLKQIGYQLSAAGVINMFPHTSHIESIAVFDLIDNHSNQ